MSDRTKYSHRKYFFYLLFSIVVIIFVIKLIFIQLVNDTYKESADNNALRYIYEYPARGLIYDRNGKILVYNKATFDLLVVPRDVQQFDTLKLCGILDMQKTEFVKRLDKAIQYSGYLPSVFESNLTQQAYSLFQEQKFLFPGFYIQGRTIRTYPMPIAAHTLGYIGEVNQDIIDNDDYYRMGDYIGISGLEKSYEEVLRGRKGLKVVLVDVHNRVQGSFKNGALDQMALAGKNLFTTLDAELQIYGESLMVNKRGGIVAIEPATGEILAIVSSPTYDPNLLVGRDRSGNYIDLMNDANNRPLYNRAIMTRYPPGSTFKLVNGLAALQEGIIDHTTAFSCPGGYAMGDHTVACHGHPNPLRIEGAVQYSCNTWFCWAFKKFVDSKKFTSSREGYDKWRQYIMKLGFGRQLGIDLPNEFGGFVAEMEYYDKMRGDKNWRANSIISVAIGQGEIGATPLQLANMAAIIANRGYYITPHVVKAIGHPDSLNYDMMQRHETGINREYFQWVVDGMEMVVVAGTAPVAAIPGITVCGKTGTAQDPPRKNHSVFIAFAPKDDPQIAIAVLVENSGFGAQFGAPIASLMIEYYLNRKVERKGLEWEMLNSNTLKRY
ncbi:MAG: penicillin-binding protein 2 [Marinilabiliales bacterium]|nr:MAG: penicillin-binding protein 2 [Marinilabiliales bacterium]